MKVGVVFALAGCAVVRGQRAASVAEVQPSSGEEVHTVWMNGPTHSSKIGGKWPGFGTAKSGDAKCKDPLNVDRYTGYTSDGQFCNEASTSLNDAAHLLVFGTVGIVVDAGGLDPAQPAATRNLLPKLGVTQGLSGTGATLRSVYDALPEVDFTISLDVTCPTNTSTYVLGTPGPKFVAVQLVRQGATMGHFLVTSLHFEDASTGKLLGPCNDFVPQKDPTNTNCHSTPMCPAGYPVCVGFVQGKSWGKCYTECDSSSVPKIHGEVVVWPDAIDVRFKWNADYSTAIPAGCSGAIKAEFSKGFTASKTVDTATQGGGVVSFFLTVDGSGKLQNDAPVDKPAEITSTDGTVVPRNDRGDVFVEVPRSLPRCGYNLQCAAQPLSTVAVVATNTHPTESRSV
eukprot:Hpha_TRINITY_DN6911_c0_g2::TRINITY_DN6911_c0_g2_i1::g.139589::m.139589